MLGRLSTLLGGDGPSAGGAALRILVFCAAVAIVVTLPSLANGFVYDDVWIVERNDAVHHLDLGNLLRSPFWPEDRGDVMWRPVALVVFALQWAAGGGAPFLFHLCSVLLYGLVGGLVGFFFTRMFNPMVGLLGGILFAVHPLHVEVTANVVGQAELWAALGYVGALLATWERSGASSARARSGLLLAVVACLAVGLGGKEQPVTFPGAVLVLWWLRARIERGRIHEVAKREWLVIAVSCVLIAGYLWLRAEFGGGVTAAGGIATGLDPESGFRRLAVMLPVSLVWLRVLFFPIDLSADYSPLHLVPEAVFGANHAIAVVIWSGLFGLAFLVRDRQRSVFVGVLLFAVTISLVSNVVVPLEVLMAERLLFLPSLGWALAMAGVLYGAYDRLAESGHRRALIVAVGLVVVLVAVRSLQRATVWRSNDVFFGNLIDDAPDSFRSHWAIGHFAFERGDSAAGERALQTAVRLNPEHPQLLEDFGRIYAATGRYEPAIPLLSHAVALDSTRLSSALPLALALARSDRAADALALLYEMDRLHGATRGLSLVRGEVLMRTGDFDAALEVLIGLIRREPEVWAIRLLAAEAALQTGQCGVALAQADTALKLAPHNEIAAIETFKARVANGNTTCK